MSTDASTRPRVARPASHAPTPTDPQPASQQDIPAVEPTTPSEPPTPTDPTIRESMATIRAKDTSLQYYAEGRWLTAAGFTPGTPFVIDLAPGGVELRVAEPGELAAARNKVSKKGGNELPVIDVTAPLLREVFGSPTKIKVRVEPKRVLLTAHEIDERIKRRPRDGSFVAAFAGAGLADAAAVQAGLTPKAGIEINAKFAEIWDRNHGKAAGKEGTLYHMSVHEAATSTQIPTSEVFFAGVCCEPFSMSARLERGKANVKRDRSQAPHQHELLDMSLWAFQLIVNTNPRTIVIENAPAYATTDIAYALKLAFARLGYHVEMRVVNSNDHGYLTKRKRTFLVGMTPDADGTVPLPWPEERGVEAGPYPNVGALLDADVPEEAWFTPETKPWAFKHGEKQKAKGNGFGLQVVTAESTELPVIKKGYFKGQGDSVVLKHPTRPDTYRWFTINEVRRIMGVPEWMWLPEAPTAAGPLIGQGVHVDLVADILLRASGRMVGGRRARLDALLAEAEAAVAAETTAGPVPLARAAVPASQSSAPVAEPPKHAASEPEQLDVFGGGLSR